MYGSSYGPQNARLNCVPGTCSAGAWIAASSNTYQWVQYDFIYQVTIVEINTQGRSDASQWVRSFTVSYSNDGIKFKSYPQHGVTKVS